MTIEIKNLEVESVPETGSTMIDVVENVTDIEQINESIEGLLNRITGLENLTVALASFDSHTPTTAALTQITTNMVRQGTDLDEEEVVPGLESIGATSVSLEGIWDTIKRATIKIVEYIKALWHKFLAWFNNYFDQTSQLSKNIKALIDRVNQTKRMIPESETVELSAALASHLAVDGKLSLPALQKGYHDLSQAVKFVYSGTDDIFNYWNDTSSHFESVLKTSTMILDIRQGTSGIHINGIPVNKKQDETRESFDHIVSGAVTIISTAGKALAQYPNGVDLPGGGHVAWDSTLTDIAKILKTALGSGVTLEDLAEAKKMLADAILFSMPQFARRDIELQDKALPALRKSDLLGLLKVLDTSLTEVVKYRTSWRKQYDQMQRHMSKLMMSYGTLETLSDVSKRYNRNPAATMQSTSGIFLMVWGLVSHLTQALTKPPARLMTEVTRIGLSTLTYAEKCAKLLEVELPPKKEEVVVPTLALPHGSTINNG